MQENTYKTDEVKERELSRYSYAAVQKWLAGAKLEAAGDHKEACRSYNSAYQLSNAVYRTIRGEVSVLELKVIGKSMGVSE